MGTEAELKEIVQENDNGTGYFDLDKFLRICESDNPRWLKDNIKPEELIEAFKTFDKDGKGTISIPQLRYMLQCLGDKLEDTEADEFVAYASMAIYLNEAGDVDYEKLVLGPPEGELTSSLGLMSRDQRN